ncbi:MAG: hypothetical protein R2741_15290 [Methanolobus sp.]
MLVDDSLTLANAGVAGLLDTRADASKHAGDFRKVVEGVNDCLGCRHRSSQCDGRIRRQDIQRRYSGKDYR